MSKCVGFTGTQRGMTDGQAVQLRAALISAFTPGAEFHHGDCIGADVQAAAVAREIGYFIVAHPGCDRNGCEPKRGWFAGNAEIHATVTYRERNQAIVDQADEMYATPAEQTERRFYSGTWMTVRMARRKGIPIQIISPDGEMETQ